MPKLADRLRAATEDDVEAALRDATFGDALAGADPAALLEFHNRMLDLVLGEEANSHGIGLVLPSPTQH